MMLVRWGLVLLTGERQAAGSRVIDKSVTRMIEADEDGVRQWTAHGIMVRRPFRSDRGLRRPNYDAPSTKATVVIASNRKPVPPWLLDPWRWRATWTWLTRGYFTTTGPPVTDRINQENQHADHRSD